MRPRFTSLGVAEDRLTVLSDIDVLICVSSPSSNEELARLRKRVLAEAMDAYGLPWDYPIELHVYAKGECEKILKKARKARRWNSLQNFPRAKNP